nr:non-ribosomal peptide synthetase [Ignavibacteria bacterium]
LNEFNNTKVDYPKYENIIELFAEKVKENPDTAAVIFGDEKLTYKELDERSDKLAQYLLSIGIKKESLVPVLIGRSIEMITGILGILKAGGAYVPVDPEYPEERIRFMLEDTGAKVILSSSESRSGIPDGEKYIIVNLDEEIPELSKEKNVKLTNEIKREQLAYVIYTSGSTGTPKGVMIEHKGVLNLALSQKDLLRLKPEMKTLQFASIGFDASCYEIFNTLLSGGSLVLCRKEDLLTSEGFEKLINKHSIDLAVLPSTFQNIIKESTGTISTIVSAGEALNIETGTYFQSKGIRLINAYGPTEITVCASLSDDPVKENNIITIGRPNPNQQIYIIDKANELCPIGVPGEICVAGVQVARGYLNRAELTSEKFISDPFSKEQGARLYKTGDSGRWLADGNIEYLGRIDFQVKIRGYRIEPGEIESVLMQSGFVKEAVVLGKEDGEKNKILIGYIVPKENSGKTDIVNYLRTKIPGYMIPSFWVELENLPLTQSGKINRKALPDPETGRTEGTEYVEPGNDTEKKLAEIWKELLKIDRVGIYDNFFELGGHSLLAMRVITAVQKEFEIELVVKDLFNFTNISDLGKYIEIQTKEFTEEKDSAEYEQFTI